MLIEIIYIYIYVLISIRKPAVVPYNDGTVAPPNDPTASPRSDSTLSAPQSGQSSPKPPRYVMHNLT